MAECLEGGEDAGDLIGALFVFAAETGGEGFGVLAGGGDEFIDGGDLGGEFGGPVENGHGGGGVWGGVIVAGEADFGLLGGGGDGSLVVRAEVADEAALFFRGALVVEGDEVGEDLLFERLGGGAAEGEDVGGWSGGCEVVPAVGFEHGGVEVVVDLLEYGDEAFVVGLPVLRGQGFAGAEFFEDVVNAGEGEVGVLFLLALAVHVEPFAKVADALLECAFFE